MSPWPVALALVVVLGAGCSGAADTVTPPARESPTSSAAPSQASPPTGSPATVPAAQRDRSAERLGLRAGWGPTRAELDRAARDVRRLDLPDLAGQVIVARYAGTRAPTRMVDGLHLGGVIVFSDNITSTEQVRSTNRTLRASARDRGRRWPLFIGVDQEGGIVERVTGAVTGFPAFMGAGAADRPGLTTAAARASGAELLGLGFSVAFAPSGDVTVGPRDPTIGSRSAGSSPHLVDRQMNSAVDGFLAAGVLPVIKHFPGHGSVPADSHVELPVQPRSLARLRRTDLVPFRAGVAQGISSVMVGHIDLRAVDPGTPSSLSRPVTAGLLRGELGFAGLVVTDALDMDAVVAGRSSGQLAVRALRAGADVLLMPPSPAAARAGIIRAVRGGELSRSRLRQAAARQVAILLHQGRLDRTSRPPGSGASSSYRLSAGAMTVTSGPCEGRLVGDAVQASGSPETVARFNTAARRAGLATGSGTSVALVGYAGSPVRADVAVALDTPYVLGDSLAPSRIAAYGDTPGTMRALVDVLLGRAAAPGRLPVPVAGVPRRGC